MPDIDEEIRSKTEAFAKDLAVLVRRAALEAATIALGGGATATAPVKVSAPKRGRGRPRKAAAAPVPAAKVPAAAKPTKAVPAAKAAPASKAPVSKKPVAAKRAPGAKRPPAELAKLVDGLGDYIKSHPGQRMEAIGKGMGEPTKELNLPIKKLLAAKKIRSEGQKRATEYFPM
jgi:hypothetical protein